MIAIGKVYRLDLEHSLMLSCINVGMHVLGWEALSPAVATLELR